jgi:CheY-like chemotaxis protein
MKAKHFMSSHLTDAPIIINDLAEGSPRGNDEPATPLKTTTLPVVRSTNEEGTIAAETGMTAALSVQAEGKDKDEAQDASRTADETSPTAVPEKAAVVTTTKKHTVLIVEDTVELGEVIQGTLDRMNLITAHETQGNKAIAKYNEMRPDVVLLDINLPDTTGWKILDHIKEEHEKTGRMPIVIIITAYGDPANRLIGKLQGVYNYLVKPFTPDEIENLVMQALSAAR